jgi:hypothetical protein
MVVDSLKPFWKPFFTFLNVFIHPNKVGIDFKLLENFMHSFCSWIILKS